MATKVYLNFVPTGRITAPVVKKVQVIGDKDLHIKRVMSNVDEVWQYDFTGLPHLTTRGTPNSYADTIYRYQHDADGTLHVWVAVVTDELPDERYQVQEHSAAATVWKATGEDNLVESATDAPTWIPGAISNSEWRDIVHDIKLPAWRNQIKKWLMEAPQYGDLVPNIVTHLGYWLKSADFMIYRMWYPRNGGNGGAVSWEVLATFLDECLKGPSTLDPDGDGSYDAAFFQLLNQAATAYPTGPTFGALWVNWWDLNNNSDPSDVERVDNMLTDVLADGVRTTRTKASYDASTYNPITEYWKNP